MTDQPIDLKRLRADLAGFASVAGVEFRAGVVDPLIDTFGDIYADAAIGVRTTTEDAAVRTVDFRYLAPTGRHDPFQRLIAAGLLVRRDSPLDALADEAPGRFPLWWGLDASVTRGFQRIWMFFERAQPLDRVLSLRGLPPSVCRSASLLARNGLDRVLTLSLDYGNAAVGLYGPVRTATGATASAIADMVGELGFGTPPGEELRQCTQALHHGYTFDWTGPKARALSFAMAATAATFPSGLHPLAERFVTKAPVLDEERRLLWNHTYSRAGHYLTADMDYTGGIGSTIIPSWQG